MMTYSIPIELSLHGIPLHQATASCRAAASSARSKDGGSLSAEVRRFFLDFVVAVHGNELVFGSMLMLIPLHL